MLRRIRVVEPYGGDCAGQLCATRLGREDATDSLSSCRGPKRVDCTSGSAKKVERCHSPRLEKTSCANAASSMAVPAWSWQLWWGMTPKIPRLSPTRTCGPLHLRGCSCAPVIPQFTALLHRPVSTQPAMPPRKKAKASAASTPLGDTQPKTPQDSGAAQAQDDALNDSWADEQETQLFKSMMKWKPTGNAPPVAR
jgi:hypothetical protein